MKKLLLPFVLLICVLHHPFANAEDATTDAAADTPAAAPAATTPAPPPEEKGKEGTDYASFNTQIFTLGSVNGNEDARLYGNELVLGTFISDYVTVEGRAGWGYGMSEATVGLDVGITYWFSWYMGLAYPVTEFMYVHAKYGFSHVSGDTSRADAKKFKNIPDDLLQSSFSTSWILSTDIQILDDIYGTMEIGRLHNDTKTQIETYHFGMGLSYQF